MKTSRSSEIGSETQAAPLEERKLESLDDITRELTERRLHKEFAEYFTPEHMEHLRKTPDAIERPEDFEWSAKLAGIKDTEGLRGFATRLEDPAHVLRMEDVAQRIATEGHEDLHRLTHPELLQETRENPALDRFYEGVTQYLTEEAMEDLYEFKKGEVYPSQVEQVRQVASEVGDEALKKWYFRNEVSEELEKALKRLEE